jgi:hypothetical protein
MLPLRIQNSIKLMPPVSDSLKVIYIGNRVDQVRSVGCSTSAHSTWVPHLASDSEDRDQARGGVGGWTILAVSSLQKFSSGGYPNRRPPRLFRMTAS